MKLASLTIPARFRGPPQSGNGGYVAGALAAYAVADTSTVRLLRPPPLERALDVSAAAADPAGETLELRDGAEVLAVLRPGELALDVPPAPPYDAAVAATAEYVGHRWHPYASCFVCGPAREPGDGLRIFPGTVAGAPPASSFGGRVVAAPWTPDASLAGTRGRVRPEFLWAALDCPGYFAVADARQSMLLGEITARVVRAPLAGEPCIVIGWAAGGAGRRRTAGTALYTREGECFACAESTWIEPRASA